jgi:Lon protease-like protein
LQFAPKHPVPVFPLPGLVVFPQTHVPLHIFELRYRTMIRDALSADRQIAMALLKPGWDRDYHGSPDFFSLACLVRFEEVEWLPNDCYNLRVQGVCRVRVERIVREYPYRSARLRVLPEGPYTEDDPLVQLEKRALLETFERLRAVAGQEPAPGDPRWSESVRYESLVNTLCMIIEADPMDRLQLLEMDSVIERGRRVREMAEELLRRPVRRRPPPGEQN